MQQHPLTPVHRASAYPMTTCKKIASPLMSIQRSQGGLLCLALGGIINSAWSNMFESDGIITSVTNAVPACD